MRQAGFAFPVASARDLFHLALKNGADLMISDASVPNIRGLLAALAPDAAAGCAQLHPVAAGRAEKTACLFYADRTEHRKGGRRMKPH